MELQSRINIVVDYFDLLENTSIQIILSSSLLSWLPDSVGESHLENQTCRGMTQVHTKAVAYSTHCFIAINEYSLWKVVRLKTELLGHHVYKSRVRHIYLHKKNLIGGEEWSKDQIAAKKRKGFNSIFGQVCVYLF